MNQITTFVRIVIGVIFIMFIVLYGYDALPYDGLADPFVYFTCGDD